MLLWILTIFGSTIDDLEFVAVEDGWFMILWRKLKKSLRNCSPNFVDKFFFEWWVVCMFWQFLVFALAIIKLNVIGSTCFIGWLFEKFISETHLGIWLIMVREW